jgi:hypothetical protein
MYIDALSMFFLYDFDLKTFNLAFFYLKLLFVFGVNDYMTYHRCMYVIILVAVIVI